MGVTQSLQRIQTFYKYHKLVQNNQSVQKQQYQLYFGSQFQLYTSKFNVKQQFTKHAITFNEIKQMQNFIEQWKVMRKNKGNLLPFNILYPINVFVKDNSSGGGGSFVEKFPVSCGERDRQLIVVHKWLGRSLADYVRESQTPLNEQSVWFIVNQLSKSLEILQESNHASYHLMPQNIWHNANHNWFLYDGRFVIGTQGIQQFYQQKLKNQHFMSQDMKKKIQLNALITNNDSLQQDVYCLGYCLIFMITGIHPKEMPKNSHQREKFVHQLLDSLVEKSLHSTSSKDQQNQQNSDENQIIKYSFELISFIKNLIKPDSKRRFTIRHIRSYLKSKQQQIFMKQVQQWSKNQLEKSQSRHKINKKQENLFQSWNIKKFQRAKSPPRQLYKRVTTQNSQGESNFTSMRTLKKQPIPKKMVMINSRQLKKPAFNLIENDGKNNKLQRSGQFTPIRKIEQTTTNRFNFQSIERKTKNQPINSNLCNRISTQIRQMNSPERCRNQLVYMSPQKQSNSSINTKAYVDPQCHQQNFLVQRFQSKPHLVMQSPPIHQHNVILSPNKVKVVYQSPGKPYM